MSREEMEQLIVSLVNGCIKRGLPNKYNENFEDGSDITQVISYPLIDLTELTIALENKTDNSLIRDIALDTAKGMIDVISNDKYIECSGVDVVTADKPDEQKCGWVIFCNTRVN